MKAAPMRTALVVLLHLLYAGTVCGAQPAEAWLDAAADPATSLRRREFAARQFLMLADSPASILVSALRGEGSDSGLRRQVAAGLLGELPIDVAEGPLLEAAFDRDYFLAEAAAAALERLYSRLSDSDLHAVLKKGIRPARPGPAASGAAGDDWLALSLSGAAARGRMRALAMRGLVRKRSAGGDLPAPLAECVWEGLLDANAELRLHAVRMVPLTRDSRAAEKLAAFLYSENDPGLLIAALRAMAEMRPPDYGPAVERHAAHADPMVMLEALAALDAMGYENALFPAVPGARAAAAFVSHPSTPVRRRAMEILGNSKNPAALEYLLAALSDRVAVNRVTAVKALASLGFTGAVGGLAPRMRDGRPEVRAEAAVALSRLGVVGAGTGLREDLSGASAPFRRSAAEALGRLGDRRAVPDLLAVLGDGDAELGCMAAEALGRLGERGAGPGLFATMTKTGDPVLADTIRKALADIYGDDPGDSAPAWDSWSLRQGMR